MRNWQHRIRLKHLYTEKEDRASLQESMNAIADAVKDKWFFSGFDVFYFRSIPESDGPFSAVEYANKLLNRLYDYADNNRIWIE